MFLRLGLIMLLVAGLAAVFSASCGIVPESSELYSENFTLAEDALVTVRNTSGDVDIVTWGKEYVEVNATKTTTWGKSELDKVEIQVTHTPGNMLVETKVLQKNARVSVVYDIKLPRHIVMNSVEVENGDIYIEGTNGSTIATTSLGSIRVKNTSGYLTATADTGKIELEGTTGGAKLVTSNAGIYVNKADGEILATTSNGSIEIRDSKGDATLDTSNGRILVSDLDGFVLRARTSNGDVDVVRAEGLEMAETTNGDIEAELAGIREEGAAIRTTNGSIVLYLSPDLNADIELKAVSGEWISQTTMQIVTSGPTYMTGILGDGGAKI